MRRTMTVVVVVAVMMVVMAAPALAQPHDPFDYRIPGKSGLLLTECDAAGSGLVGHGTLVIFPEGAFYHGTCDYDRNPNLR